MTSTDRHQNKVHYVTSIVNRPRRAPAPLSGTRSTLLPQRGCPSTLHTVIITAHASLNPLNAPWVRYTVHEDSTAIKSSRLRDNTLYVLSGTEQPSSLGVVIKTLIPCPLPEAAEQAGWRRGGLKTQTILPFHKVNRSIVDSFSRDSSFCSSKRCSKKTKRARQGSEPARQE